MDPTQVQQTAAPPGTFNPQYGIGGQGQQGGQQLPAPGLRDMMGSPMATSQQYSALSGMYAASAVGQTMQYGGMMLGMGLPMMRPALTAATNPTSYLGAFARGSRFIDAFEAPMMAGRNVYSGVTSSLGGASGTSTRFLSMGVRGARVAGGVAAGIAGVGTFGLFTAATEGLIRAGEKTYEGSARLTQGASFASNFIGDDFNYSQAQAENLGRHGGFLDSLQSQTGLDINQVSQLTGVLKSQGALSGVSNLKQFKTKLLQSLRQLKEISDEANISIDEANQIVQSLGSAYGDGSGGHKILAGIKDASTALVARSRSSGIGVGQMMQLGQLGAQTAFQSGLGRAYGATLTQGMAGTLAGLYESGEVNRSYVDALGGKEAVAATLSQKLMQQNAQFGMMFTKVDAKGVATIDYAKIEDIQSGKTSLDKEMDKIMNPTSIAQVQEQQKRMQAFLDNPNLSGRIQEESLRLIQSAARHDPSSLENVLGMHRRQIGMLGQILDGSERESLRVDAERRRGRARSQEQAMMARSQGFGFSDIAADAIGLGGFDEFFRGFGESLHRAGQRALAPFSDTVSTPLNISDSAVTTYQSILRNRSQGIGMTAADIQRMTRFRESAGPGSGRGLGGMFFGGSDMDLRNALTSDPRYQRFMSHEEMTGVEGVEHFEVDPFGMNFLTKSQHVRLSGHLSIAEDLRKQERAFSNVRAQFGGEMEFAAINVARELNRAGTLSSGEGTFGTGSDQQLDAITARFEEKGVQFRRSGFRSKHFERKEKAKNLSLLLGRSAFSIEQELRGKSGAAADQILSQYESQLTDNQAKQYRNRMRAAADAGYEVTDQREKNLMSKEMLEMTGEVDTEGLRDFYQTNQNDIDLGFSTVEGARDSLIGAKYGVQGDTSDYGIAGMAHGLVAAGVNLTAGLLGVSGRMVTKFDMKLGRDDVQDLTGEQMFKVGQILKDTGKSAQQKIAEIGSLGINDSLMNKLTEAVEKGDQSAVGALATQLNIAGQAVLDNEIGGRISDRLQTVGRAEGSYLRSLGVGEDVISDLRTFDTDKGSSVGARLLLTGLRSDSPAERNAYFQGLALSGFGGIGNVAGAASALMGDNVKARENIIKQLNLGIDPTKKLTAEETTKVLKDNGLLDVARMQAAGVGGRGSRVKANDFGSAVMQFTRAVSLFAAAAGEDPANEQVNGVGYSEPPSSPN